MLQHFFVNNFCRQVPLANLNFLGRVYHHLATGMVLHLVLYHFTKKINHQKPPISNPQRIRYMTQKLLPSSTTTMEMSNDTSDDSDSSNTSTTTLAPMDDSNESDSSDGVVTTTSADDADVFDLTYFEVTPKGDLALIWRLRLSGLLFVDCALLLYTCLFWRMVIYLPKNL